MMDQQTALCKVRQADFVLLEAGLYLNGYPNCTEALDYFKQAREEAKAARRASEEAYGPLTLSSAGGDHCFDWNKSPLPWEWEAN